MHMELTEIKQIKNKHNGFKRDESLATLGAWIKIDCTTGDLKTVLVFIFSRAGNRLRNLYHQGRHIF